MKLIKVMIIVCALAFLNGCVANRGSSCIGWVPIYPTAKDVNNMSLPLARQILKHNTYGAKLCGWV
nr:hypothetical protein [Bartonella queenslandensis]